MRRLLILADDLSGAADCGVACTCAGLNAIVALGEMQGNSASEQILSIDVDTRRLDATAAATRMGYFTHKYGAGPETLLFKKIDSTLRGHLGPELLAVLRARRTYVKHAVAVMAPAFPVFGRTTLHGFQHLHGRPLHDAEVWRHQQMTGDAHIPEMLQASGLTTKHLSLAVVRSASATLLQAMIAAREIADVLICDAETDTDLASIAEATATLGSEAIWVGSAGLAHHLCSATAMAGIGNANPVPVSQATGAILFVIGSMSRISRQQVAALASCPGVHAIPIPPDVLLTGEKSSTWRDFDLEAQHAIQQGKDVILSPGPEPEIEPCRRTNLSHALAKLSAPLRCQVNTLVAAGGETARMVLDCWGIRALHLLGEVERGVPVSIAINDGNSPELTIVTKAGEFGDGETLIRCRELLRSRKEASS